MKRFRTLIKNKISGRLSEDEARELQQLIKDDNDCLQIYQILFSTQSDKGITIDKAEQAFAAHYLKMQRAKEAE